MSTPLAPIKTPLGQDELRHRTRGLGQRYRTILLLVDGRRPVSEVLSLALKAGADTSQFEELVRLGLVELPAEAMVPEPRDTTPGALDLLRVTSVEMEVAEASDESEPESVQPEEAPSPPPPPQAEIVEAEPPAPAAAAVVAVPPAVPLPAAPQPAVAAPRVQMRPPPAPPAPPRPVARPAPAPLTLIKPISSGPVVPMQPGDEAWLQRVRELLIDTLRLDAPLFSARTFVRVRSAQSAGELTDLVWEIERHLSHARHSRAELISLQRARELLGLGNTLVAYDTEPGPDDW